MIFSTSSLLNIFFLPAKLGKFYKDLNTCFTVCLQWKCDQNPDLGNAHCKPAADGDEKKRSETTMEFLWTGNKGKDNADVLHRLLQSV